MNEKIYFAVTCLAVVIATISTTLSIRGYFDRRRSAGNTGKSGDIQRNSESIRRETDELRDKIGRAKESVSRADDILKQAVERSKN